MLDLLDILDILDLLDRVFQFCVPVLVVFSSTHSKLIIFGHTKSKSLQTMDLVRRRPAGRLYWSDIHKLSPYRLMISEGTSGHQIERPIYFFCIWRGFLIKND